MPYTIYKLVHFAGIFAMLMVLAVIATHVLRGGTRQDMPHRKAVATVHGLSAFLVLLGGFGMLARLGIVQGGLPGWVIVKLVLWVAVAWAVVMPYMGRTAARASLWLGPLLALAAGWVALTKPF